LGICNNSTVVAYSEPVTSGIAAQSCGVHGIRSQRQNNDDRAVTCAECKVFPNAQDCKKFNNLMSKVFGVLFMSDRAACIRQIQAIGLLGHAKKMAGLKMQTIKK
jgi:ribosomal protein S11